MSAPLHVVRGDLCAETLIRAGIPRSRLLVLQDSLSWGPCAEVDDDSPRNAFWQGTLQLPPIRDFDLLKTAVGGAPGADFVVWPETFLDSTLGMAWAIAIIDRLVAGRSQILLPRAIDDQPQFLNSEVGKDAMASDVRSIRVDEIDLCKRVWRTHLAGQLNELQGYLASEAASLPRWLSAIESATDRYPFVQNGLPSFVNDLLRPLQDAPASVPAARLVGSFMHERSNTPLFIDTDVVLFQLLKEFSEEFGLVALNCPDPARYPARCQIDLTQLGRDVLSGSNKIDVRRSRLLRWWGGQDLLTNA